MQDIEVVVLRELAARSRPGAIIHFLLFVITVLITPVGEQHPQLSVVFGFFFLLIGSARFGLVAYLSERDPRPWQLALKLSILASSVCWSLFVAWIPLRYGLEWTTMFALMGSIGISAGAVIATAPNRKVQLLYLGFMVTTVSSTVFMADVPNCRVFTSVFLMWGLYQSAVGKQLGQSYLKYVQENLALKLSVNQLLATVQQAARGDLTGDQHLRAEHSGPIVDLSLGVEQMLGSLRELVGVIQQFGLSMTESATYLTGNVTQQYRGLSQQALRSDQLTRTFGDMATAAQTLRAAVRKVNVDSLNTAIDARELQHDLAAVGSGLLEISSLTDTMSYSMKDMNGRIGGVREILATISQIANQTNMLSLNACIEAERAGDSGRGFRVIAQEMRRLSNQTSVAVDQVERTIREVTESSEQTLHKVTRFFSLTQAQIEQSRGVGERVDGVLGHIQEMKEQFALVDHSADSQSQTAHAASLSLREFNALQQLTAKGLEETAEFLKELRKTSTELKLLTERFRVAT